MERVALSVLMAQLIDRELDRFAAAGIAIAVYRPPEGLPVSSLRVDAESTRALAQMVLYDTGELDLVVGNVNNGEVLLDEHRVVTSELGIADAIETLFALLMVPSP